jgi:MYXO-CTERM domain-containing protein
VLFSMLTGALHRVSAFSSTKLLRGGWIALGAALTILGAEGTAGAVSQPGGPVIPVISSSTCTNHGVGPCIDDYEGDAANIDAVPDALINPETFKPTCTLTFTPIIKFGGNRVAFGWYNAKPDPENPGEFLAPDVSEVFGMIALGQGDQSGPTLEAQVVSLDLSQETTAGRYTGGEIGFFLLSTGANDFSIDPETHAVTGAYQNFFFTQHALNPASAGPDMPYYQVVTWQSVAFDNAFYFAWEDLPANGGDNDFDDLVFIVTGIQCNGGGEPCDTGLDGVCGIGTMQCQKGELSCVQSVQPGDESCNALDDDCNGDVDDGDLCEVGFVCDRGTCVPKCGGGEFRNCPADGFTCVKGLCVEEACVDVECEAGQVCKGGDCIDACDGVTCPHGRACRNGGCVDPCLGITCDEGYSCDAGVCKSCECTACAGGQVCSENLCIDEGCETQTCDAGSFCSEGDCVDSCEGAVCPSTQICEAGECIADPSLGAGGAEDPGIVIDDPDPTGAGGGTSPSGNSGGEGNAGNDFGDSGVERPSGKGGCLCATPGRTSTTPWAWLGAALVVGLVSVRRRR